MEEKLKQALILSMISTIRHATTALYELNKLADNFDEDKSEFITLQFTRIAQYGQGANELILDKHFALGEHNND